MLLKFAVHNALLNRRNIVIGEDISYGTNLCKHHIVCVCSFLKDMSKPNKIDNKETEIMNENIIKEVIGSKTIIKHDLINKLLHNTKWNIGYNKTLKEINRMISTNFLNERKTGMERYISLK